LQSNGRDVVAQPWLACWQHHFFFDSDHPICQLAKPAMQSNGSDVVAGVTGGGAVGHPRLA